MKRLLLAVVLMMLLPTAAIAQSDYGQRVPSRDNRWLTPVASRLLSSDEHMHLRRGSVDAWDISAPLGSPIYSMGPGRVIVANCGNAGGYGCWVMVDHGDLKSLYGHMMSGSIRVRVGQRVDAWTVLGQMGWTGRTSFGPHVHWEIHRGSGGRYRIDQLFDPALMRKCDFCTAKGAPVAAQGVATTQTATPTAQNVLGRILATMTAEQFATLITALVTLLMLAWWLFGLWVRVVIVATTTTATVATIFALLFLPGMLVQAGQQSAAAVAGGDTWKAAYAFMRRWEGARCVHDPVRTFKGITNGTYNAWRRDSGLGPGDVCRDLTEQQAEVIYFQRYWLASGADRLSSATAIAVFDHAVNAGVGSAKGLLAQCGDNAQCVIQARFADYRTKSNFPQYGRAWFNRVNDMISFLKLVK